MDQTALDFGIIRIIMSTNHNSHKINSLAGQIPSFSALCSPIEYGHHAYVEQLRQWAIQVPKTH
jgi:hypothetical protein